MKLERTFSPFELMGIHAKAISDKQNAAVKVLLKGLPYTAYTRLGAEKGFSREYILPLLGISTATLKRRAKEKHFTSDESNRLYRFASLIAEASNIFSSKEKAIQWFKSTNRALSGDTPIERLKTEIGYQQVQDLLNRIRYGIFS